MHLRLSAAGDLLSLLGRGLHGAVQLDELAVDVALFGLGVARLHVGDGDEEQRDVADPDELLGREHLARKEAAEQAIGRRVRRGDGVAARGGALEPHDDLLGEVVHQLDALLARAEAALEQRVEAFAQGQAPVVQPRGARDAEAMRAWHAASGHAVAALGQLHVEPEALARREAHLRDDVLEREGALKVTPDLIEVVDVQRLESIAFGRKKGGSS